jgi:AbrB family looped-hinge helix DNA binding protein
MTRVTSKGQVTIPKDIRDKLGIGPGSDIGFHEEGGQVVLRPEAPAAADGEGETISERLVSFGRRLREEGKIKPLGMTVDEYMDLIRGYSEDADDPGFQRHS